MRKTILASIVALAATVGIVAQERVSFTGTALIYGTGFNTRTVTRTFTMRINGISSANEVTSYLRTLQEDGQTGLIKATRDRDLGTFSLGGEVGRNLNAVTIEDIGSGKRRVRAILQRWLGFGELRGGYRSIDYPFSYIEIIVNENGSGEGTFIPAAQIRFKTRNGQQQVEIEDFGALPGRLMGVKMRGRLP